METWREIAQEILYCQGTSLSENPDLEKYLERINSLAQSVNGTIRSRQVVAHAIATWEYLIK